jgi:superfamily II DNA or RNA helicase
LVIQTSNHIKGAGTFEAKNDFIPNDKIIISMAQTLRSRIKKTPEMINDFDLIIIDECHILCYEKILKIATCKIIGFTATPVSNRVDKYFYDFDDKKMYKEHLENTLFDQEKALLPATQPIVEEKIRKRNVKKQMIT